MADHEERVRADARVSALRGRHRPERARPERGRRAPLESRPQRLPPDCGRPWHPCAPRVCAALLPRIPLRQGGEARVERPWRRPLLARAGARDQHAGVRGGGDVLSHRLSLLLLLPARVGDGRQRTLPAGDSRQRGRRARSRRGARRDRRSGTPPLMCGIAGIVDVTGRAPVDADCLRRMNDRLFHRGPDDAGYLIESRVGLAMRRLAIIDLNTGQQPVHNEDKTLSVVFNGEIYNYRELRAELHAKGHRFTTTSDTEVLVHLYEEHRERCVERLRGMFAFAIWDRQRRTVVLARDRLGIKPLYYAETPLGFVFASELKAIAH